jgi:hypothetical protein
MLKRSWQSSFHGLPSGGAGVAPESFAAGAVFAAAGAFSADARGAGGTAALGAGKEPGAFSADARGAGASFGKPLAEDLFEPPARAETFFCAKASNPAADAAANASTNNIETNFFIPAFPHRDYSINRRKCKSIYHPAGRI